MPGSTSNGNVSQSVDWPALKAWIAQKEAYEAQHGRPAPLTDVEASAIAVLLQPAPRPEPVIGKENWIGVLNHFLQVREKKVTFSDEARQIPRLGKAPELRWACFAKFDSTGDTFPRAGNGIDEGASLSPDFTRKQDAKQFAAKCACEWLMENGLMRRNGDLPMIPPPFPSPAAERAATSAVPQLASVPTRKRSPPSSPPTLVTHDLSSIKQETSPTEPESYIAFSEPSPRQPPSSPKQKPAKAPRMTSPAKPSASNSMSTTASSSAATSPGGAGAATSPSDVPATKRVTDLCTRLGFPAPDYRIGEDDSVPGGNIWKGTAYFDNSPVVPEDIGTVRGIYTKKATKEKMAELILDWLLAQQKKRGQEKKAILEA
ncbi:uncharacterized protein CTRU02_212764 [Colletotrichum truncatum]|uniref:Uncharacterized protein n=1 Tax=Colletotrichum truncatum TaxID=5467 RepID=A0ACC3YIU9_COLTU|nr:uncharacterized protein CTRU02_05157 [Colletotrichum truncatum]KAF6794325.1 hypothetical protein CTRU02_05157 [Colletotrichum truncatum]